MKDLPMLRRSFRRLLALWAANILCAGLVSAQVPETLLIYYSFPSVINGSNNAVQAAAVFADYDFVVLGDCLQEDGSSPPLSCPQSPHPDHTNTVQIIQSPLTANTRFFGYIDLGVTTQNLSLVEIQRRAGLWAAMGVEGVLLDDYGYDFQVSRQRQRAAVQIVHDAGLNVIANGFRVDDVFSAQIEPQFNPDGLPPLLDAGDYYLYESHQIRVGDYVAEAEWQSKAQRLETFRQQLGTAVLSITTADVDTEYSPALFFYAWYSALMYEHRATGWGEVFFSAGNATAPWRTRPSADPGPWQTPVTAQNGVYQRSACAGRVVVNTQPGMQSAELLPESICLIFADGFEI